MDLNYFNNDYLNPLLTKLTKEKKTFSYRAITMLKFQNMTRILRLMSC